MLLSVIVPAFNEQAYLGKTLDSILRSIEAEAAKVELIVVDNASTDATPHIASSAGARVAFEPVHNVARARNRGAAASSGEVLVFIDADTLVPIGTFQRIREAMADPSCYGGAFDIRYDPKSALIRAYLAFWRMVGNALNMAQGAAQFCRRDAFIALGGYDERLFMGEDVDFHWRLRGHAKRHGGTVSRISDLRVSSSARRFDLWPAWKTLVWTNPLLVLLFQRQQRVWRGWYEDPPR